MMGVVQETPKETVYSVTARIIGNLENTLDSGNTKMKLAQLRNSIGRELAQSIEVWAEVFPEMPQRFLSQTGELTAEELSVFAALQLYARHQQGNPCSVNLNNSQQANVETQVVEGKSKWANMGDALRTLRNDPHREGIDRRFNAMITATTIEELLTHLRHLISILKAKNDVKVNYANLSQDLLWLQRGQAERVRMRWGQSYYCSPDVDNIEEKGE